MPQFFGSNPASDTLVGGAGNDQFYTVGDDSAVGGEGNDTFYDQIGNSLLNGGDGNDTFYAGQGADTLIGGLGNDAYWIDADDILIEAAGEGTDTVNVTFGYTLLSNFENLNVSGAGNITVSGNDVGNVIKATTTSGVVIYALGGDDTVFGSGGDDVIIGGAGNDQLFGGAGTDYVSYFDATSGVTVDLALTGYQNTGGGGIDKLSGFEKIVGSNFDDTIYGTSDANRLEGGLGADTMRGRGGDDFYSVDNVGDQVIELANEGLDTVNSTISYSLGANLEVLSLYGTGNINGTGNNLDNGLNGNSGDNVLDGGGGNDNIRGGAGNDTFVLATTSASGDTIRDFGFGDDILQVDGGAFGLSAGALDPSRFVLGNGPTEAFGQFYFGANKVLYWDADGTGAGVAVSLAWLPGATLSASDFVVV